MPDPQLAEFCRIRGVADCRPDVFRRIQRYVQDVVQPRLDERDTLIEAHAALQAEHESLKTRLATKEKKAKGASA